MYWLNELSHYHEAKVTLKGLRSGQIDATGLTPNRLRQLMLEAGHSQRDADKQAAKFHLELARAKK